MSGAAARKLFGTDGIRGIAGEFPLDARTIYATGLALGHSLRGKSEPKVILGRDTRESSPWIAFTVAAALRATGVHVESAGVIPTPAVAFLTRRHGFDAGVVISASHNPWRDNGIKLFGADGFKLPDATELAMEDEILRHVEDLGASDAEKLPDPSHLVVDMELEGQRPTSFRLHPVFDGLRSRAPAGGFDHRC